MSNEDLLNYIKQAKDAGKSNDAIRQELLSAGWPGIDIDEAFRTGSPPEPPSPMRSFALTGLKKHHRIGRMVLWGILGFIGLIILIGIFASISDQTDTTDQQTNYPSNVTSPSNTQTGTSICSGDFKSEAKTINFKELDKNPDTFYGQAVKFTGEILQIQEGNNRGIIRLAVTKTSYGYSSSDVIYIEYSGYTEAVQDDIITVYGYLTGSKTYTSQANYQITIPSMTACTIETSTPETSEQAPAQGFVSPTNATLNTKTEVLGGVYLTVNKPENFTSDNPSSYYQPKAGNKYLSVYVSFDNESQNPIDYNPLNFKVVDSSGGSYTRGSTLASKAPELNSGTLNPSNRVSGYILFEVPANVSTAQFTVHYEYYAHDLTVDFK